MYIDVYSHIHICTYCIHVEGEMDWLFASLCSPEKPGSADVFFRVSGGSRGIFPLKAGSNALPQMAVGQNPIPL